MTTKLKAHARDLEKKLEICGRDLSEALEQQAATSEVLQRHLQFDRRTGAGFPDLAGKRDEAVRGQLRRDVALRGKWFSRRRATWRVALGIH